MKDNKDNEIVIIKKGKHFAQLLAKDYNSPKKFNSGLTQKEIVAKNGYRLANEAEINKHLDLEVEKPKEVKETKTEQVSPTVNKITDVGEKIGGARKDLAEKLGSVTSEDIKSQPLSKVFPKPDFDKLISEKGISKDVAILLNYLYSKIPSKPRKHYQVSRWVDKVNEVIDIYRNILEEEGG